MRHDKRKEYIAWDSYFMGLAAMASFRSKDPSTQNGACIVQDDSPVALGYNGFCRGCDDDDFPWAREAKDINDTKFPYVEHSERNAIFNAARKGIALHGATLYLYSEKGYYPCNECARAIIQSGIKKVVMAFAIKTHTDKYNWDATKKMFKAAKIQIIMLNTGWDRDVNCKDKLILDCELMASKFKIMAETIKNS